MNIALILRRSTALLTVGLIAGCASSAPGETATSTTKSQLTQADPSVGSRIRRAQKQGGPTQDLGVEALEEISRRQTAETVRGLQSGRD